MTDAAIAFEPPHVRAAATSAGTAPDRISVRDYVRAVEIGAFSAERGRTQRLRFNVVLEVRHAPGSQDDVDRVLSYDTITEAIEAALAGERLSLLETLAERIAASCLADPRALRAFVRVEKLDRGPGALGVEIERLAAPAVPAPSPPPDIPRLHTPGAGPLVALLPADLLEGPAGPPWRDALAGLARPAILVLAPSISPPQVANEAARRAGLLLLEQAAWALAAGDPRFTVAASRTEIAWAMRARQPAIWAPVRLVADAVPRPAPDASDPAGLAAWLAGQIPGARAVAAGWGPSSLPDGMLRLSLSDRHRLATLD